MRFGVHNAYSTTPTRLTEREAPLFRPVERVCEECGGRFQIEARQARRVGRGRFCSRSCASAKNARIGHLKNPQHGAANPNWKGGISKNHYHYANLYRQRHPERHRAGTILRAAVASGQVVRPDACTICAAVCKPHAHHDDYSQPLQVLWLCKPCHIQHHAAVRREKAQVAA